MRQCKLPASTLICFQIDAKTITMADALGQSCYYLASHGWHCIEFQQPGLQRPVNKIVHPNHLKCHPLRMRELCSSHLHRALPGRQSQPCSRILVNSKSIPGSAAPWGYHSMKRLPVLSTYHTCRTAEHRQSGATVPQGDKALPMRRCMDFQRPSKACPEPVLARRWLLKSATLQMTASPLLRHRLTMRSSPYV